MTDTTTIALITAVPPTLVALGGLIVGIINSYKANKIHVLVNSNLAVVKSDLITATDKVEDLQELVNKLNLTISKQYEDLISR